MNDAAAAKINLTLSGVLMTAPWWLDTITTISQTAALFLPILGAGVGILQIMKLIRDWWRKS